MLEENILEANLVFIYSNYEILKAAITSLEKRCLPLADSIEIVENIENKFKEVSCSRDVFFTCCPLFPTISILNQLMI